LLFNPTSIALSYCMIDIYIYRKNLKKSESVLPGKTKAVISSRSFIP
jgi:hypothetical protein